MFKTQINNVFHICWTTDITYIYDPYYIAFINYMYNIGDRMSAANWHILRRALL